MCHSFVIVVVTIVIVDNFQWDNASHVTLEFASTSIYQFDSSHVPFYVRVDFDDAREGPFMPRRRFNDENEIPNSNVRPYSHPLPA